MQELRFVAVSEDGRYAVLAVPGRSARFTLPIDERLRAVALGQTSRLVQYEIEVESPLRPKEIQARIRAGETVEEIADAAGIAVERVRWFEGPVLAERAYAADQAQTASVRRHGDSTPGPRLGEIVAERLSAVGADPEDAQWDAKKRGDGNWQVELTFTADGRPHVAAWVFDPRRRHAIPADDNAARMSLPGAEPPQPAPPPPGEATVTRLAPRLSSTANHGQGPGSGWARHERPGPVRPAIPELVLIGGQLAAGEAEAPPELEAHRVRPAGPVERPGHRRPPVDHRGRAIRGVHVPAADVEAVPRDGILRLGGLDGVVETAEEQRGVRDVLQGLGPVVEVGLEVLLRDPVPGYRLEGEHVFAHQSEVLARAPQLIAFGGQDGINAGPFRTIFVFCCH
jgi:hypothetical protein